MRGALLYSGYIRTLPEVIENHIKCFSFVEHLDLYFSLWDRPGYIDRINSPDFLTAHHKYQDDQIIDENILNECIEHYSNISIRKIKIEPYINNQYQMNLLNGCSNAVSSQFYKIYDCCTLLDPTIDYDFVARMRCDIRLENMIEQQKLIDCITNNHLLFTEKIWYNHSYKSGMSDINDMLWIGKKSLCKQACQVYKNVEKINNIIQQKEQIQINFGENLVYLNLVAEGIENHIELFDFDFRIIR
jgi:hypothetical protein